MPYLRRLVLLLTISTSLLLVTIHLLHISRPHQSEPLHPVLTQEEAEKQFRYLKTYDHPPPAAPIGIPNAEYADRLAHGGGPPVAPGKDDVLPPAAPAQAPAPPPNDRDEMARKLYGKLPPSKMAPPNSTAWHGDRNLWKVKDALGT